jgi:hypothetical protein
MSLDEFPHSSPDAIARATQGAQEEEVTADTKYSKAEVNYRPAGSSNTRCEHCSHFRWGGGERGTGSCRIVMGRIEADGVCDAYEGGGSGLTDLITGEPTY